MSLAQSAVDLRLKSVLLATDFSPASVKPLHHALAIAKHYGAKLYIAHVVSPAPYLMAGPEALQLAREGATWELEQLEQTLVRSGSLNGSDHELIIRQGIVWEELRFVIFEKQIDLVVVGTHARSGIEKLLLGSTAEQVFRDANCPVLTVGPHSYREERVDSNGRLRTFLFATDFGEASLAALPHAVSLANQPKTKLILAHVLPATPVPNIPGWYSTAEVAIMRENARMACLGQLQHLAPRDEPPPVESELVVQFGTPSEKILQIALGRAVDLIILGLRRSSLVGPVSHIPWATAYEIVCGAGCPVLTVRQ
jgi:nucleotide-binding universal stress UspA family protein